MIFSILICTLGERRTYLDRLLRSLNPQLQPGVEILQDRRGREVSIGAKRNALLHRATGDYVAFVDDDDRVSDSYVSLILGAVSTAPADCVELHGRITTNGKNSKPFIHTLDCKEWHEKDGVYWRSPNHLNPVRRGLALAAGFPETSFGEDHEYSKRLLGKLVTEAKLPKTIYFYDYRTVKPELK